MGRDPLSMDSVIELGRKLPGVEEGSYYGAPALKLRGRMLACTPINESAEVNSAVISMGLEQRAGVIAQYPSIYYVTEHYAPHPTVLIRLSRMSRADLERALHMAMEYLSAGSAAKPATSRGPRAASSSRRRPGPARH